MKLETIDNVRFIHIFEDEKFVDLAIGVFESVYKDVCEYMVISEEKNLPFNYVKSPLTKQIVLNTKEDYSSVIKLINKGKSKQVVMCHGLGINKQKLIDELDESVLKVWFIWGFDFYDAWKPLRYKIFEPETRTFLQMHFSAKLKLKNLLFYKYNLYKIFKKKSGLFNSLYYKSVQKIDIAVPVLPSEKIFLKKLNSKFIFAPFSYGSLEQILGDYYHKSDYKGNNILVGNSATASSNHVEVFKKLATLNLQDRKVVVPLSYGDKAEYLNFVLKKGKALLGDNFHPITNYMTLEDYNKLLASCNVAIFNHIRQQAVFNIITMGFFRAKLFFNSRGVAYKYYKEEQLNVYSLEKLNQTYLDTPLTEIEYNQNKTILNNIYSQSVIEKKVKTMFQVILKHPKING